VITTARRAAGGVALRWSGTDRAASYAVYRFAGGFDRCGMVDARNLVATVRNRSFVDATAGDGRYTYVVTALDRTHNESRASAPRVVR
jgi:fibronectin type 3 domain-containing protein